MEEEEENKKEEEEKAGAKGSRFESQKNEHSGLLGSCTRVLKRICGMKTKKQCFLRISKVKDLVQAQHSRMQKKLSYLT